MNDEKPYKFDELFDRENLRRVLCEWVLGVDGYDGAVGKIYGELVWTMEMNKVLPWDEIEPYISKAIPCRDDGANILCDVIVNGGDMTKFNEWVEKVINDIAEAYRKSIDLINEAAINKRYKSVLKEKIIRIIKELGFQDVNSIDGNIYYTTPDGEKRRICDEIFN